VENGTKIETTDLTFAGTADFVYSSEALQAVKDSMPGSSGSAYAVVYYNVR